eukprot:CAMPEP_0196738378 /NCGR_PEP_ID=MMETSP1091-20130531/15779_1 /TAXON_ID=302021 /ORGANISM="Rhodomonas sp., Strain CCMP768" /LENGTH=136 /DNA_ID=CAMNT_0042082341 /DNA_START=61 /DNA_END=471 /DNA_ORIENTATION=-
MSLQKTLFMSLLLAVVTFCSAALPFDDSKEKMKSLQKGTGIAESGVSAASTNELREDAPCPSSRRKGTNNFATQSKRAIQAAKAAKKSVQKAKQANGKKAPKKVVIKRYYSTPEKIGKRAAKKVAKKPARKSALKK